LANINCVLGPLSTDALGFTLMHEHLILAAAGTTQNYPELLGSDYNSRIIQCLNQAKEGGIGTVVDTTTLELGRDVNLMANVSRLTGVNIIACAGWWKEPPPTFLAGVSAEQLARIFVREIQKGISGTNIKAGILKAASDISGVTDWQEKVLRAVARAHNQTRVPITLHSWSPRRIGKRQIAILREEGVDLSRVMMNHSNDTADIDYLSWLLEQGCYLGMDRYPGKEGLTANERTKTLKALIDAGYGERLLLSHDVAIIDASIESPSGLIPYSGEGRLNPYGFLYIKKVVFPQLRELGVSESTLELLCTANPRKFFEGIANTET
jgi:phosphotriesterase-related protein